ncbi:MAG: pyridoxal-phosphate dependent enzyme [Sphingomonadales bacterium]|nr:pyridoxal-phosphate dependent enzyme [Sphingomonadales bacterium]
MTSNHPPQNRAWADEAVRLIEADYNRSADTHLIPIPLPRFPGVQLYLKDESSHPTGSLKHRLARSLFLYALCNGRVGPDTTIVEASSGSTAVSEAYFARMLGLKFIAVVPRATSAEKIAEIEFYGGRPHFVEQAVEAAGEAARLADQLGGVFMDQFTFAERATDWRGNNNIAESIFAQMALEQHPIPEGIGRAHVEPSFVPEVIDRMEVVSDARSIAAARLLSERLGRRCGGSTGTNLWACATLAEEMAAAGVEGSIVTILCDDGNRYASTYFDDAWLDQCAIDWRPAAADLAGRLGWSAS